MQVFKKNYICEGRLNGWRNILTDIREKALSAERVDQNFRQSLVVATGVADVGKHLGEGFLVVDADKILVLHKVLLFVIISVDVLAQIVLVGLLVDEALQG